MAEADANNGVGGVERARFEAHIAHLPPEKKAEILPMFEESDGPSRKHFLDSLDLIIGPYANPRTAPRIPGGFIALLSGLPAPLKEAMDKIMAGHIDDGGDNPIFWSVMLCAAGYRDGPLLT
jgi:hypothetical protein